MSEQTIQDGLYSIPVKLDKYTCLSLGATTIQDLVKNKEISGLTVKECRNIKANKPDVLVLNKNKEIVVFIEMKQPSEFNSDALKRAAKYQELLVARQTRAKIYVISDGDTFIWFNPLTKEHILDEIGNPIYRKINPKDLTDEENKELASFIDDVCYCIGETNNQLIPKDYIDPTPLAKKTARILQNMALSSAKNSLYTFVEMFTSLKPIAIKKMKDTIPIPVKSDGTFDLEKQKELAAKYEQIETIKSELIERINNLTSIIVTE